MGLRNGREKAILSFIILITIPVAFATYQRSAIWRNDVPLWRDVVGKSPHKARGYNNIGLGYYQHGLLDDAQREYIVALRIEPGNPGTHINLGNIYYSTGRLSEAMNEYTIALRLNPNYSDAHHNLGLVYYHLGKIDEAIDEYMAALKFKPDDADAYYNLGLAYLKKGLKQKAIEEFETTLKLRPDFSAADQVLEAISNKSRVSE